MKTLTNGTILALILCMLLPFYPAVQAEEPVNLPDGVYQVELNLQSEDPKQEILLDKTAELSVKKGKSVLTATFHAKHLITSLTVKQQGTVTVPVWNEAENLVQFDMESPLQAAVLSGKAKKSAEEEEFPFSVKLSVNSKTLPKQESAGSAPPKQEKPAEMSGTFVKKSSWEPVKPRPSRHSAEAVKEEPNKPPQETAPEEPLAFDRTVDQERFEKKPELSEELSPPPVQVAQEPAIKETAGQQAESPPVPFDAMKVGVLLLACVLSGFLLIRRLVKKKKPIVTES